MRQELDQDQVSAQIDASPQVLYDIVADVTRTHELSPEVVACRWLDGATGPLVGARFEAVNKAGRGRAWKNRPVVVTADRGREFAFVRTEKLAGSILWRYRFTASDVGTLVTESYEVTRPVSAVGWFVIGVLYGLGDRRSDLRAGMEETLGRLRAAAEAGARR